MKAPSPYECLPPLPRGECGSRSRLVVLGLGILTLVGLGCSHEHTRASQEHSVGLTIAVAKLSTNECSLTIELANQSRRSLEFKSAYLPWDIANGTITFALIDEDGLLKKLTDRTGLIVDAQIELPLILGPGESKTREVSLDRYYQELRASLQHHDVTLLWVYWPRVEGQHKFEPVTGVVRLSRIPAFTNF